MSCRSVLLALWALSWVACGPPPLPEPTPDAGPARDGGTQPPDAGVTDGGTGQPDAGDTDGGTVPPDAGVTDGGTVQPDAGYTPPLPCGATELTLVNGRAQVSGTTVSAGRQAVGSCGGIDGREAVYAFTPPSSSSSNDVVITVTSRDEGFQPVVYLREGRCDSPQSEISQACAAAHLPGGTAQFLVQRYVSGTYYVFVDGLTGTDGAFDLSIDVNSRAGKNCADVLPLPGRRFTVRSMYSTSDDSFTPACTSRTGGGDRVYRLETDRPSYLSARVEDADGVYGSTLSVAGFCGARENTCQSRSTSTLLPAGTHYLWLDRYVQSVESSWFVLRGEFTDPLPGDACAQARPLVFSNGPQGGTATDSVTAAGLHDDGDWGCWSNGTDFVYSFTTDQTLSLRATATDSLGRTLSLTLVRAACTQEARMGCGAPTLDVASVPAGSYFLWVDGLKEDSGAANVTASLAPVQ